MLISSQIPNHGQYVVACNDDGKCWVEQWDRQEPLGNIYAWFPISYEDYRNCNSMDSGITASSLFIKIMMGLY